METIIRSKMDLRTYFALKARVLGTLDRAAGGASFSDTVNYFR
jgi:hypothetical protein